MADDRETCRIDGTHLQTLVDISTPHQLAHVVTRTKRKRSATTKKPVNKALGARKHALPLPPPDFATGSQPLAPLRDDDPELTIEREADTSTPIDQIATKAEEPAPASAPEPESEPEPLPPPPVHHRTSRDAVLGGLIGLALLAASWLAAVSF